MKLTSGSKRKNVRWLHLVCGLALGVFGLSSCQSKNPTAVQTSPLNVVTTTPQIGDLVRNIGGDRVRLTVLIGPGVDPHLYKITPTDAARLKQAAVIFYNGNLLEGKISNLLRGLSRQGRRVYAVTEALPSEQLIKAKESDEHFDPHLWSDVSLWSQIVPTIVEGLSGADPGGREIFMRRAARVQEKLNELHQWVKEQIEKIPAERRVLVTSHDAFNYFGRAYGMRVVSLQGLSTVSEASLADVVKLVDFVRDLKLPAIFVESSVNPAAVRRVSADAGVQIGGELFSDSMGAPGEMRLGFDTGTYEGMIRYNVSSMVQALQ